MILLNERVVINGNDINIGNIKIPAGDHIQDLSKLAIFLPQSVKLRLSALPYLSSLSPLSQSLSLSEINHGSFIRGKTERQREENISPVTTSPSPFRLHTAFLNLPCSCRYSLVRIPFAIFCYIDILW